MLNEKLTFIIIMLNKAKSYEPENQDQGGGRPEWRCG